MNILRKGDQGNNVRQLQTLLNIEADGVFGDDTEDAVKAFQVAHGLDNDGVVGPATWAILGESEPAPIQPLPDGEYDYSTKEGMIAAIKAECERQGIGLPSQMAYVLATTEWETGHTFKPVKEAFWKSEDWREANLRYFPWYGRGLVQLTWQNNYIKYTNRLRIRFPEEATSIDLIANPDQAMVPKYAVFILVDGFKTGAFTGKKIADYIGHDREDFVNARRCINALDKAPEIALIAQKYLGG